MTNVDIRQQFSGAEIQTLIAASNTPADTPTVDRSLSKLSGQLTESYFTDALTGNDDISVTVPFSIAEASALFHEVEEANTFFDGRHSSLTTLIQELRREFIKAGAIESSDSDWVVAFDGACRNNPEGPAGVGATLSKGDDTVETYH